MLLNEVRKVEKNHIIFEHPTTGAFYYEALNNDTKLNVFNETMMNIYLEQFEETLGQRITYQNITNISTLENHDNVIDNLPQNLKHLFIMSTMCNSIVFPPNCKLETIYIDKSNITQFPDIRECQHLVSCKIIHSAITNFNITYELPATLKELNLQCNLLNNKIHQFPYSQLEKLPKTTKINLSDNHLKYNLFPETLRMKCGLVRQETYIHNPINFRNVRAVNINANINNNGLAGASSTLLGSQNVHLSSVNKSVLQSVNTMKKYVKDNNIKITPLKIIPGTVVDVFAPIVNYFAPNKVLFNYYYNKNKTKIYNLENDFELSVVNSITELTYKKTFELIWAVLCHKYSQKEINMNDVFERIVVEIVDGQKMCFTGKYNRLINSMVGIIDGVQVGHSTGEQLQLEFGIIIEKFNKSNNSEIMTYPFSTLVCDTKSILEMVEDENIKNAWLEAIMDMAPEPKKIKYTNGIEYYKTWNDDILDLREKKLIGYYMDDDKKIVFLDSICSDT
jgi:hypothetical protein